MDTPQETKSSPPKQTESPPKETKLHKELDPYASEHYPHYITHPEQYAPTEIQYTQPPFMDTFFPLLQGETSLPPASLQHIQKFKEALDENNLQHAKKLVNLHILSQLQQQKGHTQYFKILIPNLRDRKPIITANSRVNLRPIFAKTDMPYDVLYVGWVTATKPFDNTIIIKCDHLIPTLFPPKTVFHCIIEPVQAISTSQYFAADFARLYMPDQWLHPLAIDDATGSITPKPDSTGIDWSLWGQGLNWEQQKFIKRVMATDSRIPNILSGPAGTGKTLTLVSLALKAIENDPKARILMCAPTNSAADTLALRLQGIAPIGVQVFRHCSLNRPSEELATQLLPLVNLDSSGMFCLPEFSKLMQKQIIVSTLSDITEFWHGYPHVGATNFELQEFTIEWHNIVYGEGIPPSRIHWQYLIIDEAAQAIEPDIWSALTVVAPNKQSSILPKIVLAGDPFQLGTTVYAEEHKGVLEHTYFERILQLYQDSGDSNLTTLHQNFRSEYGLLIIPQMLFYGAKIQPLDAAQGASSCQFMKDRAFPIIFSQVNGEEFALGENLGWKNMEEVEAIAQILKENLKDIHPTEVGVMSPYREQVYQLRKRLRAEDMGSVNSGIIEDYQGQERDLIIFSTVRTSSRFVDKDLANGIGIIGHRRRLNVALTRARNALIIVGDARYLQTDSDWRVLLSFCVRNKSWHGPVVEITEMEDDPKPESILETSTLFQNLTMDSETRALGEASQNHWQIE